VFLSSVYFPSNSPHSSSDGKSTPMGLTSEENNLTPARSAIVRDLWRTALEDGRLKMSIFQVCGIEIIIL